jgi:SAM-dependent methyltransferase
MKLDHFFRKLIPSSVLLGKSLFSPVIDLVDQLYKQRFPEYSHLPPASLRLRVGMGNKLLRNYSYFVRSGNKIVAELYKKKYLASNSKILEVGCGCGRIALALMPILDNEGTYLGIDVDQEMIDWCKRNIIDSRFEFHRANVFNSIYNPTGYPIDDYSVPSNDNTYLLVISASLFTHLLYEEVDYYIKELGRVMKDGSYLHMTFFFRDFMEPWLGDRWSFMHKENNCYIENIKYPAAAVAYDLKTVEQILIKNNLELVELYNLDRPQQTLIATKTVG